MELIATGARIGVIAVSAIVTLLIGFALFFPLVGAVCRVIEKLISLFGGKNNAAK